MVDATRVRALLSRLRGRIEELGPYSDLDVDDYLQDRRALHASKYLLLTAIEDCLAIANHLIAAEGYRAPTDYADAFRSLRDAGVVSGDLSDRLEAMARFRNLLVHLYAEVDDRRVHDFLGADLKDLDTFIGAVLEAFPELE